MVGVMKAIEKVELDDRRYRRALSLSSHVMHAIDRFISEEVSQRDLYNVLLEVFMADGVEVLTDYDRVEFGLPPRDGKGWTAAEVAALERARLERMLAPFVPKSLTER